MAVQPNLPVYARGIANPATVVGIDGEPPIFDETQVWRRWAMHDIYLGQEGHRKWVPKVGDFVIDTNTLIEYRVISIDVQTLVPELLELNKRTNIDEMTKTEGRFFAGGSLATPCARQIFFDDSVARPTLKIPSQFHLQGSTIHHAIAFKGAIAGNGGIPISVRYDQNFNVVGNEIPLMPVRQRDPNNHTQWYIPDFYSSMKLDEGEMIVICIYDDRGGLVSRTNWIVEHSALLRDVSDSDRFVSAISMESMYIDATDESNILIPEQILKNSINLMGKVHYSDGSMVTYPVDGNKFELIYLDSATESVASTKGVLVLKYNLAPNETSVNAKNVNNNHFITRTYNYTIVEREGAYSVKLYPVPVWVNDVVGYRLDWYLFTLDRNQWIDVSNDVYITHNSPSPRFNGKLYGPVQQLNVAIDLGVINNTFRQHIHPQTVDIRLVRPAAEMIGDRYIIGYSAYQTNPYGEDVRCLVETLSGGAYRYNISCGITNFDDWLEKVYYPTQPQFRTNKESGPPTPDMFKLIINNREYEFPIRRWNETLTVPEIVQAHSTVKVLFFSRMQNNDLFYSIAPMPVLIS